MAQKLEDLLLHWELCRRKGESISIEDLCGDCVELRDQLRVQIAAIEKMDGLLELSATQPPVTSTDDPRRTGYDNLRPGWEPITGYRLENRLGKGGFGEVWKAIGPGGFAVALKFVPLHDRLGASELRSLDVLKTVHHPNLLTIFGAWQEHGFLIVAMELADMTLLDRFMEATATGAIGIPSVELVKYMDEIARGLDYLNQPGTNPSDSAKEAIQHRDIKPQNILLMGGGVKIGDFGLMRILKKTVADHTGSLTLSYAPPEFFQGHTARSSDQYSLAVTYCQLRGGRLPFVGNPGQVTAGHLKGKPDLTMLPFDERAAVERALQKDHRARWPTCVEFVKALTLHGSVATVLSKSPCGAELSSHRQANGGRFLLLGSLAAVVMTAVLLLAWRFAGPGADKQEPPPPVVPPQIVLSPIAPLPSVEGELKLLSGVWIRQTSASNGSESRTPTLTQLRIHGDQMTYTYTSKTKQDPSWKFVIDPAKNPKTIDRMSGTKVVLGIYQVDANRFTYAYSPTGDKHRPTDFSSPKGSKVIVQVYSRK